MKKVTLLSNSSTEVSNNSLTEFRNYLAGRITTRYDKSLHVHIDLIGFHANFSNVAVSTNNDYPCLIMLSKQSLKEIASSVQENELYVYQHKIMFDRIKKHECIYIDETKSYNMEELSREFYNLIDSNRVIDRASFIGYPTKLSDNYLEFGHFGITRRELLEKKIKPFTLFFHHNFIKALNIDDVKSLYRYKIGSEEYFKFQTDFGVNTLKANRDQKIPFRMPKVVNILCKNVKPIYENNGYSKRIGTVILNNDDVNTYKYKEFKSFEVFELENKTVKYLDILLEDECGQKLRLSKGLPTLLKLHFIEKDMNMFHVRCSSEKCTLFPNNSSNSFRVKLPRKFNFSTKWCISLSSILIPSKFLVLSDLHIDFYLADLNDTEFDIYRQLDRNAHNCMNIINQFQQMVSDSITVIVQACGKIIFNFKKSCTIKLEKDLACILGSDSLSDIIINGEDGYTFTFDRKWREIPLFPHQIYLYTNIVKPSIVGEDYRQILKIIPLEHKQKNEYTEIEFETEEYLHLSVSQVEYIDFFLKSHSGCDILFKNTSCDTFLRLVFKEMISI